MNNLNTYEFKGKYGITDLWAEDPWMQDYGNWPTFSAHFGVTEQGYAKHPESYHARIRIRNEAYIKELKASGKFGQEFTIGVTLKHNVLFDDNKIPTSPLESHRIIFLNNE